MSAHFTRVSLALLTAVCLLGCQDQGSGPVGVDGLKPQFAKKCESPPCGGGGDNGGTKGEYLIEFFGDMTGDGVSPEERITSNGIHVGRFGEVTIENGILFDHTLPQRNIEFQSCFGGKGFMAGDPDAPVTLGFEDASGEDTLGDVGLGINHVKKKPVTQAGVVIHFRAMGYCLKSTAHYMLWSWRFRLLSSVAAWTIPVRGWSWTSSSPTMRHAWSTWRVCAGRKGLCAWAVAGWERSGEHRGGRLVCPHCRRQTSVLAGTVFHRTRSPLRLWFLAAWELTSQKYGANALGLQRVLGLGSYKTAWVWLHKLRRAMVRPDRDQLSGVVQVDESYVGGVEAGVRGRETIKKAIVAIAAEVDGRKIGRIRLRWVPDLSAPVLRGFVKDSIAPASTVHTDGWPSYQGLAKLGLRHTVTNLSTSGDPAHVLMSAVHRVASLLKR